MFTVTYGGKGGTKLTLVESDEHLVVRTADSADLRLEPLSLAARNVVDQFETVARFKRAGVEVLCTTARKGVRALRDEARAVLKKEPAIKFAGRVLLDRASEEPVVYTENFFVKFYDDQSPSACTRLLKGYGLEVRRPLPYARNAYFVSAPEDTGQEVFKIAQRLLDEATVEPLPRRAGARGSPPRRLSWTVAPQEDDGGGEVHRRARQGRGGVGRHAGRGDHDRGDRRRRRHRP